MQSFHVHSESVSEASVIVQLFIVQFSVQTDMTDILPVTIHQTNDAAADSILHLH